MTHNDDNRPYGMAWNNVDENPHEITLDNPPPADPPPADPPPDNPPPSNPPPSNPPPTTPDPQAQVADLQRQLAEATGGAQATERAALDTTRGALRVANPHLPDSVFEADTLAALTANVEAHNATAEHIRTHPAATPVNPAGGSQRQTTVPENLWGVTKIAFALNHPGPGMTE